MTLQNRHIIVSHPTGNANVRGALDGFYRHQILAAYYTSIATQKGSIFDLISKFPGMSEFKRRAYHSELSPFIHQRPSKELLRLMALKMGFKKWTQHEFGKYSIDAIYSDLDMHVAKQLKKQSAAALYAYEDGALHSFKSAQSLGMQKLYDLPIGYWKAARVLMAEEIENRPDWAATLSGFNDSQAKTDRKDEEIALADHVFVASSFTAKTLEHYPQKISNIHVIPYGFPKTQAIKSYQRIPNQKIKLLFVGGLSQRKGIANVFEACELLKDHVELTVVGRAAAENVPVLVRKLAECNYIPSLAHADILELMKQSDVLLFPSLFEGFGLVITEAMSQGTPVITTDRTAGPDLIQHNENGWLIPAADSGALKQQIEALIANPELIEKNGRAAHALASARPWKKYSDELAETIISLNF